MFTHTVIDTNTHTQPESAAFELILILCALKMWPLDGNECFGADSGNVTDVVCPLFCFLSLEEGDLSC